MSVQKIVDIAGTAQAVNLGSAVASQSFQESVKCSQKLAVQLKPQERGMLEALLDFPILFVGGETITNDHPVIACCRILIRNIYDQTFKIRNAKERVLFWGAGAREISMYWTQTNCHFYVYNGEGKDVDRVIRPALNSILDRARKRASRNDIRVSRQLGGTAHSAPVAKIVEVENLFRAYCEINECPDRIHMKPIRCNTICFEDSIYNLSEKEIVKAFIETNAMFGFGYAIFPMELIFTDLPNNPLYFYKREGKDASLTYRGGYSTGYTHNWNSWSTLLRKQVLAYEGVYVMTEIVARAGPMAAFKMMRTNNPGVCTRTIELRPYERYVRLLDIDKSVNRVTGRVRSPLHHFSAPEREVCEVLNYLLAIPRASLTFQNTMLYIRRRIGGVKAGNDIDIIMPMRIEQLDVPKIAVVLTIHAMIMSEDVARVIENLAPTSVMEKFIAMFKKISRAVFFPITLLYDWILSQHLADELFIVSDPSKFQQQMVTTKADRTVLATTIPVYMNFEIEETLSCDFCARIIPHLGKQKVTCHPGNPTVTFRMTREQIEKLKTSLINNDMDPVGLKNVKERAATHLPPDEFSLELEVEYIEGGPGTGKSHVIRELATEHDLIMAPFTKLMPDYKNITKDGRTYDLTFKTQHRALETRGHSVIFVDEWPSMPMEYLMIAAHNNGTRKVYLVGDHRQTKVQEPAEGMYIGNHVKIEDLPRHRLIVNFRNPYDTVALLNMLYDYDMEPKEPYNGKPSIFMTNVNEIDHTKAAIHMAYSHAAAKLYIEDEKATVRSQQGTAHENVTLYVSGQDSALLDSEELNIVALSRHKENLNVVIDNSPEAAKWVARLGYNQQFLNEMTKYIKLHRIDNKTVMGSFDSITTIIDHLTAPPKSRKIEDVALPDAILNRGIAWSPPVEDVWFKLEKNKTKIGQMFMFDEPEKLIINTGNGAALQAMKEKVATLNDQVFRTAYTNALPAVMPVAKEFVSRGATKICAIDNALNVTNGKTTFVDLCGGPGGFAEYLVKVKGMSGFGFTLPEYPYKIEHEQFLAFYGVTEGGITDKRNRNLFVQNVRGIFKSGVDVVVADGASGTVEQMLEIYIGQQATMEAILAPGGTFVMKLFDLTDPIVMSILYLLTNTFREVKLIKPYCSNQSAVEKYVCAKGFDGTARMQEFMQGTNYVPTRTFLFDPYEIETCKPFIESYSKAVNTLCDSQYYYLHRINSIAERGYEQIASSSKRSMKYKVKIEKLLEERQKMCKRYNLSKYFKTFEGNSARAVLPAGLMEEATENVSVKPMSLKINTEPDVNKQWPEYKNEEDEVKQNFNTAILTQRNMTIANRWTVNQENLTKPVVIELNEMLSKPEVLEQVHEIILKAIERPPIQDDYNKLSQLCPKAVIIRRMFRRRFNFLEITVESPEDILRLSDVFRVIERLFQKFSPEDTKEQQELLKELSKIQYLSRERQESRINDLIAIDNQINQIILYDKEMTEGATEDALFSREQMLDNLTSILKEFATYKLFSTYIQSVRSILRDLTPKTSSEKSFRHKQEDIESNEGQPPATSYGIPTNESENSIKRTRTDSAFVARTNIVNRPVHETYRLGAITPISGAEAQCCYRALAIVSGMRGEEFMNIRLACAEYITTSKDEDIVLDEWCNQEYFLDCESQGGDASISVVSKIIKQQIVVFHVNTADKSYTTRTVGVYPVTANVALVYYGAHYDVAELLLPDCECPKDIFECPNNSSVRYFYNIDPTREKWNLPKSMNNPEVATVHSGLRKTTLTMDIVFVDTINHVDIGVPHLNAASAPGQRFRDVYTFINQAEGREVVHISNATELSTHLAACIFSRIQPRLVVCTTGRKQAKIPSWLETCNLYDNHILRMGAKFSRPTREDKNPNRKKGFGGGKSKQGKSAIENLVQKFKSRTAKTHEKDDQIFLVDQDPTRSDNIRKRYEENFEFDMLMYTHLPSVKTYTTKWDSRIDTTPAREKQEHPGMDAYLLTDEFLPPEAFEPETTALNELESQMCEGKFVKTTFDVDFSNPLNARHRPMALECKYQAFGPGYGNHFTARKPMQTARVCEARYLNKAPTKEYGFAQQQLAKEVVDLWFDEHVDKSLSLQAECEMNDAVERFLKDATTRNYLERFHGLDDPDYDKVRFFLKNIFKPKDSGILDRTKAGQGISAWSVELNTMFAPVMRILGKAISNMESNQVVSDAYVSELEMIEAFRKQFMKVPTTANWGYLDFVECDAGQNEFTQQIEKLMWKGYGMSEQMIEHYYKYRHEYTIIAGVLYGKVVWKKPSGEPGTLRNNENISKTFGNYVLRGMGPVAVASKGDDFAKRQLNLELVQERLQKLQEACDMKIKIHLGQAVEFCGLVCSRSGCFPSIKRKLNKIIGHRYKTYEHFCEYQNALRDWVKLVEKIGVQETTAANMLMYRLPESDVTGMWESVVSFSHIDKEQYDNIIEDRTEEASFPQGGDNGQIFH